MSDSCDASSVASRHHCRSDPLRAVVYLSALLRRRDLLPGNTEFKEYRLEKYPSTDASADIISSCMCIVQPLREELSSIERHIKMHILASHTLVRDYSLLISIKSVGPRLAMHMFAVLRSHNFESAEQAAAFISMVPVKKRAGTSVLSRPRMSEMSLPGLRAKLYMSDLLGQIHNKRMHNIYDGLYLRGKTVMVAIVAQMRMRLH